MKYIIMCGGSYTEWKRPRQLIVVKGEPIVARTIRLLKEAGVKDIAISSNNPQFEQFGVPVLKHDNFYHHWKGDRADGHWCNCFYPMDEPVCYVFGDVVFSPEAIKKIVETNTDSIELFGSAPPFSPKYTKPWVEPFAFKVWDIDLFWEKVAELKSRSTESWRSPLAWELWNVIKGRRIDINDYQKDYTVINDYTCDIDHPQDAKRIEEAM